MLHQLLDPFFIFMMCIGFLTVALWLRRKIAPRLITSLTVCYILLYIGCTPLAMHFALGSLEWRFEDGGPIPDDRQAIVVLGGNITYDLENPAQPTLGDDSMHRCLGAMEVYRAGSKRPIVLTGGMRPGHLKQVAPTLAEMMERFLRKQSLDPEAEIILEDRAWNTYQNAKRTTPLLRERDIQKIILITDAIHMPRAERCFRSQGFEVTPYAVQRRTDNFQLSIWSFLPSVWAVQDMKRVTHEWLGLAWYSLRGFI
jgi:uncharacterized SAM-binding protein YcdF (DUF218 family)